MSGRWNSLKLALSYGGMNWGGLRRHESSSNNEGSTIRQDLQAAAMGESR